MPLTKKGKKVMSNMKKEYGSKKGKQVFYASINKGKSGSKSWHKSKMSKKRMGQALKKMITNTK
jgi:hypothetical protein